MRPPAVKNFLSYCEQRMAGFEQYNDTGLIEIRCCLNQGQYKVEYQCGNLQNFLIPKEDLAVWKTTPLSRQREPLETVEAVIAKLDSALHETFLLYQGYATIVILHRGRDNRYGFRFSPTIVHGIQHC
ncbi:hypothetical protein [Calothrix sp. PCC 7507]|uniref:hypothetical protein n=1 Tax=Calothrix sp. PCC 7507 TaxID=99598 RepID=UPI00029F3ECA|nr:hypothetical protein [Calothrix sp. PCC 7507]AFY35132.1 hypothetical protein Cal7507_4777 [Calothrix sp. PCC 7507]